MPKVKYYSLDKVNSKKATYNVIFGLRSNGKTYAVLKQGLLKYINEGKQMAIVRRWKEDFTGKRGATMFDALVTNDEIRKATKGEWSGVSYYASKWYLSRVEENKLIRDETPLAFGFALSEMEHDKSTSYPDVTTILFDEFISRMGYLKDEFVLFINVISTIVRGRMDVTIYMCGNTVNKYCPYFSEMGLNHIQKMRPGDIDIYSYGDSGLTVAVEYAEPLQKGKKNNDFYFAFDNPKLKMITQGAWEIDIYPHLPCKFKPQDIIFRYFIQYAGQILQCNIINVEGVGAFTYIHQKTTPMKKGSKDIMYTTETYPDLYHRRNILKPIDNIDRKIVSFFEKYKVFYQSNEIGEVVRNYLLWCRQKGG